MTTITIKEPKTILELASLNATLPLRLKQIRDKVNKTLTGPPKLTTPIAFAMSIADLSEQILKDLNISELEKRLEAVEEREGRFVVSGYAGQELLKDNVPIEHVGTAMFQATALSVSLVECLVQKAEESLKKDEEFADFSGLPETPAS